MRIIIAGAGAVGRHLAKLLSREDMDISLIDERQDRLGDLDANYDLLTKVGSPTSIGSEAGVHLTIEVLQCVKAECPGSLRAGLKLLVNFATDSSFHCLS